MTSREKRLREMAAAYAEGIGIDPVLATAATRKAISIYLAGAKEVQGELDAATKLLKWMHVFCQAGDSDGVYARSKMQKDLVKFLTTFDEEKKEEL